MGLLLCAILSLPILFGAFLSKVSSKQKSFEQIATALAFGSMVAMAFFDLLPEVLEDYFSYFYLFILVLMGIGGCFIIDQFVPEHDHEHGFDHDCSHENSAHIGVMTAVALVLHNFIEGMSVYSIFLFHPQSALVMALGIAIHNIPMGMILCSTLQFEKKSFRHLLYGLVGFSAFFGAVFVQMTHLFDGQIFGYLLALTLGMILYISFFELLPHLLHAHHKSRSTLFVLIGFILTYLTTLL